jgi:rRNA processing protein Gar1
MQLFGKALHISKSGNLVVKGTLAPQSGTKVFTEDKKAIGKTQEVFGPVRSPYISIRLNKSVDHEKLPGKQLYIWGGKN